MKLIGWLTLSIGICLVGALVTTTGDEAGAPAQTLSSGESSRYPGGVQIDARDVERWVVDLTNQERKRAGLSALSHDPAISNIARAHSSDMERVRVLTHDLHGKDPTDRALDAGYDCRAYGSDGSYSYGLSENVAERPRVSMSRGFPGNMKPTTFDSDSEAVARGLMDQWMTSPGHKTHLMDREARRIGVGVAIDDYRQANGWHIETVYATQNFSECE